ncbi:MAG: carboxylating nicotinate-nucleotide diphosphorylase [Candidatus Wallbacteria bacterium]|nr:carboxylating nicotinate-nucleotide diphosphorylase [Candidatus Wallbacteria bacterium]
MNRLYLKRLVELALIEDLGFQNGPDADIFGNTPGSAMIEFQEEGIVAGLEAVVEVFRQLSPDVRVELLKKDGDCIQKGDKVVSLHGKIGEILSGERTALNFLQHCSGIATRTRNLVNRLPKQVKLLDTRKTVPGLRALQKYSVRIGGGYNHRYGLTDLLMLKTNQVRYFGSVKKTVEKARKVYGHRLKIEVEVSTFKEFEEALYSQVDIVMLDNFSPEDVSTAAGMRTDGFPLLEASGGIDEENIETFAKAGIDMISMGALTHSVKVLRIHLVLGS